MHILTPNSHFVTLREKISRFGFTVSTAAGSAQSRPIAKPQPAKHPSGCP